jgi:hypothetical protein
LVIPPRFDEAYDFTGEVAEVSFSGKEWGYIDRAGKILWRAPQNERPNYFEPDPLKDLTKDEIQKSCR